MKKLFFAAIALSALSMPSHAVDESILAYCKGNERCELDLKLYAHEQVLRGKMELACKYGGADRMDTQHCKQVVMDNLIVESNAEEAARIVDAKYGTGKVK